MNTHKRKNDTDRESWPVVIEAGGGERETA
jgi:hypothetical protein